MNQEQCCLNGNAIEWRDELNTIDTLSMEAAIIRDEKIDAKRRRARELDSVWGTQRGVTSELRIHNRRFFIERQQHSCCRNRLLILGSECGIAHLHRLDQDFTKRKS